MKKAKIMLVAIAVLGVFGAALAFKFSSKFTTGNLFCYTTIVNNLPTTTCRTSFVTCLNNGIITTKGTIYSTLTTTPNSCIYTTTVQGVPTTYYCTIFLCTLVFINAGDAQQ